MLEMKKMMAAHSVSERVDELEELFDGSFAIPKTSPSSPSAASSASSSEFEFTVSLSPTTKKPSHLCPADDLFYKGQLLPLHLSPRLDMVRTLLASASTSSSSDSNTSRDSNGSSTDFSSVNDCDSSRPSSVMEDDELKKLPVHPLSHHHPQKKPNKYFSLSRFSSVFNRRDKAGNVDPAPPAPTAGRKIGASAKEVIMKYVNIVKKVKPLYDKLSPKNHGPGTLLLASTKTKISAILKQKPVENKVDERFNIGGECRSGRLSYQSSFSGNLRQRYPVTGMHSRTCAVSCPSSMRSSPTRSGVGRASSGSFSDLSIVSSMSSSMEELQSAIQGAIAHCKSSMAQPNLKKVITGEVAGDF